LAQVFASAAPSGSAALGERDAWPREGPEVRCARLIRVCRGVLLSAGQPIRRKPACPQTPAMPASDGPSGRNLEISHRDTVVLEKIKPEQVPDSRRGCT